jgi:hypothetical protein
MNDTGDAIDLVGSIEDRKPGWMSFISQPETQSTSTVPVLPACSEDRPQGDCVSTARCLERFEGRGYIWVVSQDLSFWSEPCDLQSADAPPPDARPQVTQTLVLRAFRRLPLPESTLSIQPPGGRTLVNFETIFSTRGDRFTRVVRILGQRVELDITPAFTYHFGDGEQLTTEDPGRAYRDGLAMSAYLIHVYDDADVTVLPRVDTTYSARFRVGAGPWRDLAGTVTVTGAETGLRVVEARPVLVAD